MDVADLAGEPRDRFALHVRAVCFGERHIQLIEEAARSPREDVTFTR